jgi:hypothetical protein
MDAAAGSNAELLAAYLDAVTRQDASAVDRYFAPNVEYMVNGTPAPDLAGTLPRFPPNAKPRSHGWVSTAGVRHSRASSRICIESLRSRRSARARWFRREKAAAFGWFRLRALSTGRTADIAYSLLFERRDGLIVKYHFLENTFDVAATFQVGGSWMIATDGAERHVPSALDASEPQNVH